MKEIHRFRVVTYNVHKCRGLDRRVRPSRIVEVLREIDADIIALQEILSVTNGEREDDQPRFIADELGFDYCLGENRRLRGGAYGNVVLSRLPMTFTRNYDLSTQGREARGCLRADVDLGIGKPLHVYNVHLGTAFFERREQARKLLDVEILNCAEIPGPRLLLGDFNEWTHGLASKSLGRLFESADIRLHLQRSRTYPGVFPFLHLDHIYYDQALELVSARLHRNRIALVASDHLPIVADFRFRH